MLDFVGKVDGEPFEGGDARGYLLELGSDRLIPGFEEQLEGATAGDTREVKVTFPEDYGAEHLAGKEAVFESEVKEVKEKKLPDLDDDFAADAGGFDSLAEMRDEIASKIAEVKGQQLEAEFRENVVDAVAANADDRHPRRADRCRRRARCGTRRRAGSRGGASRRTSTSR